MHARLRHRPGVRRGRRPRDGRVARRRCGEAAERNASSGSAWTRPRIVVEPPQVRPPAAERRTRRSTGTLANRRRSDGLCDRDRADHHGDDMAEDPALIRRVAEAGIPLPVCPSSNVVIANRFASLEHPFRRMRDAGLLDDDQHRRPRMTNADLGREYARLAHVAGLYLRRDVRDRRRWHRRDRGSTRVRRPRCARRSEARSTPLAARRNLRDRCGTTHSRRPLWPHEPDRTRLAPARVVVRGAVRLRLPRDHAA